jgi:hypothetical protein
MEGTMSRRLREPIPWQVKDQLIKEAQAARARYMRGFFAGNSLAALYRRWRYHGRVRRSNYGLGSGSSHRS